MQQVFARSLCGSFLAVALFAPSIPLAYPLYAQSGRAQVALKSGPIGKPVIKGPGATMDLIITVPGVIDPKLMTTKTLTALGEQENNYNAAGDLTPIPIVVLGSADTPAVLDVFTAIAKLQPNTIVLMDIPRGKSLTIQNYAVATGAMVFKYGKSGTISTFGALAKALNDQSDYQVPVLIPRHRGANSGAFSHAIPLYKVQDVNLPASVDLSGDLPPIGNQGDLSSCGAWSTSYYYMTALEGRVHKDWDLSSPDHQFSPAFIYNQADGGKDNGTWIGEDMQLLQTRGDVPRSLFSPKPTDFTTLPSFSVRTAALAYHIDHFGALLNNETNPPYRNDITPLKKVLASGNMFVVGMEVFDSLGNYKGGVYNGPYPSDPKKTDGHAMVVVGYDDNAENTGIGAFLIANSWGSDYGEQGYVWISYDDFRKYAGDAWAMSLTPDSSSSASAGSVAAAAVSEPRAVPAVRYQADGLFRAPRAAAATPSVSYYSDGTVKLAKNLAKKDFIATITFTYERDDAEGNPTEQHTYTVKVEAQQDNDEVVSQWYRLSDGAFVNAQVDVDTGGQTF